MFHMESKIVRRCLRSDLMETSNWGKGRRNSTIITFSASNVVLFSWKMMHSFKGPSESSKAANGDWVMPKYGKKRNKRNMQIPIILQGKTRFRAKHDGTMILIFIGMWRTLICNNMIFRIERASLWKENIKVEILLFE